MFGFFKKPRKQKVYELQCILCFKSDTFTTDEFVRHLENSHASFKAEQREILGEPFPFTPEDRKKLLEMDPVRSRETIARGIKFLNAAGTESIHILKGGHPSKPQIIYWVFPKEHLGELEGSWLRSLISNENFVAGYCGDKEDMLMQSTTVYGLYKAKGIKQPKTIRNEFGDMVVDISGNPGRKKLVRDMWLMSCWQMWFGKPFYDAVAKEKILAFPRARAIRVLDGITNVELYADPFDASRPVNRKIQQAFRDWIDMDTMEKTLA